MVSSYFRRKETLQQSCICCHLWILPCFQPPNQSIQWPLWSRWVLELSSETSAFVEGGAVSGSKKEVPVIGMYKESSNWLYLVSAMCTQPFNWHRPCTNIRNCVPLPNPPQANSLMASWLRLNTFLVSGILLREIIPQFSKARAHNLIVASNKWREGDTPSHNLGAHPDDIMCGIVCIVP